MGATVSLSYFVARKSKYNPAMLSFSKLIHKKHDFLNKENFEYEMRVLIFCTKFFQTLLILGRIERGIIKNLYWSSCNVPVTHVRFKLNLNILYRFSKNIQTLYFTKIRQVGVELLNADGRTDRQTYQS
jgi:hypothetical protein